MHGCSVAIADASCTYASAPIAFTMYHSVLSLSDTHTIHGNRADTLVASLFLSLLFLSTSTRLYYTAMLPLWVRGGKPIVCSPPAPGAESSLPAGHPPPPKTPSHAPDAPAPPPPPRRRLPPPPPPRLPLSPVRPTREIHFVAIPCKAQRLYRPPPARSSELHPRTSPAQEEGYARPRCRPLCLRPQARARGTAGRRVALLCLSSYAQCTHQSLAKSHLLVRRADMGLSLTRNSHYEHLPTGPWWDLIRPHLTLIKTQVPDSIYGRPLKHFAHKADVLRLLAMKYSGGIYLDIDIYVYESFSSGCWTSLIKILARNRLTICCTTLQRWVWKRPLTLGGLLSIPKVFV